LYFSSLTVELSGSAIRNAVRQKFLRNIKFWPLDGIVIDVPANPFGHFDALGIALGVDMTIFQLHGVIFPFLSNGIRNRILAILD
jgi:hypothetical protein